jgi:hypothetical protein
MRPDPVVPPRKAESVPNKAYEKIGRKSLTITDLGKRGAESARFIYI